MRAVRCPVAEPQRGLHRPRPVDENDCAFAPDRYAERIPCGRCAARGSGECRLAECREVQPIQITGHQQDTGLPQYQDAGENAVQAVAWYWHAVNVITIAVTLTLLSARL